MAGQFCYITARKRSLGEGNIFTVVCHSVHGGGGGLYMMSLPVWLPGPMFIQGGVVSVQAGSPSRMGLRILLESFHVVEGFAL